MFALLGSIPIGLSSLTGPVEAEESEESELAQIKPATGKPAVQDMGDNLSEKRMRFFFDETFCRPEEEMARLRAARAAREPLPWSPGDGSFTGLRYIVQRIEGVLKKTTATGRIVRIEASLTLLEAPVQDLTALERRFAAQSAPALAANAALNVIVRRG